MPLAPKLGNIFFNHTLFGNNFDFLQGLLHNNKTLINTEPPSEILTHRFRSIEHHVINDIDLFLEVRLNDFTYLGFVETGLRNGVSPLSVHPNGSWDPVTRICQQAGRYWDFVLYNKYHLIEFKIWDTRSQLSLGCTVKKSAFQKLITDQTIFNGHKPPGRQNSCSSTA